MMPHFHAEDVDAPSLAHPGAGGAMVGSTTDRMITSTSIESRPLQSWAQSAY